jgi:hypothetical protein
MLMKKIGRQRFVGERISGEKFLQGVVGTTITSSVPLDCAANFLSDER